MTEIRIYMEGAGGRDRNNSARLREGMRQFLSHVWEVARRRRVRLTLVACGGRGEAHNLFRIALREHSDGLNILLVDSEGPVSVSAPNHLAMNESWHTGALADEQVHFMAQAMEAWFIADPEALTAYYGQGFAASALPGTHDVERIPKDDLEPALKLATRRTKKGEYHKTRHAFDLLAQIDPAKVRSRAPHCERLFRTLLDHLAS